MTMTTLSPVVLSTMFDKVPERVQKMCQILLTQQETIRNIDTGCVELHFDNTDVKAKVTGYLTPKQQNTKI